MKSLHTLLTLGALAACTISSARAATTIANGYLLVTDLSNSQTIGWVSSTTNFNGQFTITTVEENRLGVSFNPTESRFSISTTNSNYPSHSYLGAMLGYWTNGTDLVVNGESYAYLTPTDFVAEGPASTNAGSGVLDAYHLDHPVESSIWSIDSNGVLTAHWTNTSQPDLTDSIVFLENTLILTADSASTSNRFGVLKDVSLTFVPVPEPSALVLAASFLSIPLLRRRRTEAA